MTQFTELQFIDHVQTGFREGDANIANKLAEAEHVRVVEKMFHLFARNDFDALTDIFPDDVTLEIFGSPDNPMAGLTQGREKVIETTRNNFALVEEQRPEILSVVAQGDTVVVVAHEKGRFRPTGRDYELHWMQIYSFKDGKIARIRELLDSGALVAAAQPD
jgi:ketosteroid isomerase-like protein